MAARLVPAAAPTETHLARRWKVSPGAAVLALALPLLFLHVAYQPSVALPVGSATAFLSDFAVLAVVVAAAASLVRDGTGLRPGRLEWIAGGALIVWIAVEVVYGAVHSAAYGGSTHAVTAAKFAEYALLAPATAVLVRRRADLAAILWSLTLWCAAATVVALAQFFGAHVALTNFVGWREESFIGYADFSALAVAVTLVGVVALALPRLRLGRALGVVACLAGGLGTILAGAIAASLGLATAAAVLLVLLALRREPLLRAVAVAGSVAMIVLAGTVAIRGNDLHAFARFAGTSDATQGGRAHDVQTYSQRSLLAWIGYRIWLDHPLLGVGWQGSSLPASFEPVLPAARRRFPTVATVAFPARGREYGVQNAWIEALADLGLIGLLVWVGTFAAAAWTAFRAPGAAPLLGLLGTAVLVWLWTAQGFYAGIPLDALTALLFGLAAVRTAET